MALITLNFGLSAELRELVHDLLKYMLILLTFHLLVSLSGVGRGDLGIMGELLNNDFMTTLVYLLLSVYIYHMVFRKLVEVR